MVWNAMDITTFPSDDEAFRLAVDRLTRSGRARDVNELLNELRPLFPRVAIFERQLSGDSGRYYAYRDGRYEPSADDVWWTGSDTPTVRVSASTGRLAHVSDAWARFMNGAREELIDRHYTEFLPPAARHAGVALFDTVLQAGTARSLILVVRADGATVPIEFHAELIDGEIEVAYRSQPGDDAASAGNDRASERWRGATPS